MGKDKQAKLIYVLKILWEETDEQHPLSAKEIAKRLEAYGVFCERKVYTGI